LATAAAGVGFIAAVAMASVTYEYDKLNRLTRVTYDDGSVIVYHYDAAGNRTARVMNTDPDKVYLSTRVDPRGNGLVERNPEQVWYDKGTPVELTAVAGGVCTFVEWTGDVPQGHEHDNPLNITADDYLSLTANFVSVKGDADTDCDVDLADFGIFQRCFTGPDGAPIGPDCRMLDFDGDEDVDLDDYAQFHAAITGPE